MSQKMNEKTNNLMSRHEEIKKVFLQVGSMFGLPNEIIKTLYLIFKYSKEEEVQKIRIVYNNLLLLRTLYPVPKTKPRKWSDTSPPKLVEEREVNRMNNPAEPELAWIANKGLVTPLPEGWKPCAAPSGELCALTDSLLLFVTA